MGTNIDRSYGVDENAAGLMDFPLSHESKAHLAALKVYMNYLGKLQLNIAHTKWRCHIWRIYFTINYFAVSLFVLIVAARFEWGAVGAIAFTSMFVSPVWCYLYMLWQEKVRIESLQKISGLLEPQDAEASNLDIAIFNFMQSHLGFLGDITSVGTDQRSECVYATIWVDGADRYLFQYNTQIGRIRVVKPPVGGIYPLVCEGPIHIVNWLRSEIDRCKPLITKIIEFGQEELVAGAQLEGLFDSLLEPAST